MSLICVCKKMFHCYALQILVIVMCRNKSIVRRSSRYTYVGIDFIVVIGIVKVLQSTEMCTDR